MPPQQAYGLLDLLDDGLDFRAHLKLPPRYVMGCGAARNAPSAELSGHNCQSGGVILTVPGAAAGERAGEQTGERASERQ
jgi:hypothetical protein